MDIKEKIKKAPDSCGVYLIKNADGDIIYVGKAVSVKKRLRSHFRRPVSAKQQAMVESAHDIDYIPASSAETALLLEAALVKRYSPKYNAALKDDKAYPVLKLTIHEDFPRLFITRRKIADGSLYFGPYTNAKLLRKALKLMGRLFPLRSCRIIPGKPCLDFYIGGCLAPCIGKITRQDYKRIVENVILFLEGESEQLKKSLVEDMNKASSEGNFELAAYIRDQIKAISSVTGAEAEMPAQKTTGYAGRRLFRISTQLEDLRRRLNLSKPPFVIEAFDVSNIAGKEAVGSMVVFKNGRPFKDDYRKFKIKTVRGINDYSMIREIVNRRYSRLLKERATLPDLILIDGGKGHLLSAKKQLRKLGIWQVPVIGIAKSFELIYTHEEDEPLGLDPSSPASLLIQRIRDEAHRFAISYHRLLRRKKVSLSELDDIHGIGSVKKRLLVEYFGSVDEIKMAEIDDLTRVKYIDEKQARKIYDYFNRVSKQGI
ncbi:MAG: excinuclease ABC subunit UvrC [Candidatus Omnitrophota bacterium]|nr:MAG: excinuclease ABC subunit UvrC [Candidatus Omnitrophota bacterium]